MRPRIISMSCLLMAATLMMAQGIKLHQYWIDADYGSAQSVMSGNTSFSMTIPIAGFSSGIHFLNYRALNTDDEWGTISRTLFYIPKNATDGATITNCEYWIDSDYAHRMSGSNTTAMVATVNISHLSSGIHFFNYRAVNSFGEKGTISRTLFYIPEPALENPTITAYEYWLDDDVEARVTGVGAQEVYQLTMDISEMVDGEHTVSFRAKNSAGDWGGVYTEAFEIEGNASELPGDLSGDGVLNGSDLVALVNIIMNETDNPAADVNGDGDVNGSDLVFLVNMIMNAEPSATRAEVSAARGEQAPVVSINAEPLQIGAGEKRELAVVLRNLDMKVTMVQMDVQLPDGLTLIAGDEAVEMAGRTSWGTHQLYVNRRGENTVRVMLASGRNALIEGTDGDLLRLKLVAEDGFEDGDIVLDNMLCTSPTLQEARPQTSTVRVYGNGMTGIVEMKSESRIDKWYNMNGQRMEKPGKGVYIRDGKKVIIR